MATAKKKQVKVRDLKPSKDAKGGAAKQDQSSSRTLNAGRFNKNQSSSKNLL
jgi:hypothetical protein